MATTKKAKAKTAATKLKEDMFKKDTIVVDASQRQLLDAYVRGLLESHDIADYELGVARDHFRAMEQITMLFDVGVHELSLTSIDTLVNSLYEKGARFEDGSADRIYDDLDDEYNNLNI